MPKCKNIELAFDEGGQTYDIYNALLSNGVKKEQFDRGASLYERVDGTSDYKEIVVGKLDCRITSGEVWDEALSGKYCRILKKSSDLMPPSCLFNDLDPKTVFDEFLTKKVNDAVLAIGGELKSHGFKPKTPPFEKMMRLGLYYFTYVPDANWMNWKKNSAPDELGTLFGGLDNAGLPGFRTYLEEHGGLDAGRINDDYNERNPLKALEEWRAKCTDVADILNVVFRIGGIKSVHVWADGNSAMTAISASEFVNTPPFITTTNHVFLMAGEGKDAQFYDLRNEQPSPDTYKGKDLDWYPLTDREFYAIRHLNSLWRQGSSHETMEKNCGLAQEMEMSSPAMVQTLLMCSGFMLNASSNNETDLLKTEELTTKAVQLAPDNYLALHNLGLAQTALKKYPEAGQNFKAAIRANKYFLPPYSKYADALTEMGQMDHALQVMLEGIDAAREGGLTPNFLALARLYVNKKDYDKAAGTLDEAEKNGEKYYLLYLLRGIVAYNKGDLDSAERDIKLAAALAGKDDVFALTRLYAYYSERKRDAEAFIVLKALFAADRSDEEVANALCQEYLTRKEWRKAGKTIEESLGARDLSIIWKDVPVRKVSFVSNKAASISPATVMLYAYAIWHEGREDDAGLLFGKLNDYFKQANSIEAMEKKMATIEESLENAPQKGFQGSYVKNLIVPVYYDYIQRLSTAKNFAKAVEVGQKLLAYAPDNINLWARLADLYFKTGMFKDAAKAYSTVGNMEIANNKYYSLEVGFGWLSSLWNAGEDLKPALDYLMVISQTEFQTQDVINNILDGMDMKIDGLPEKLAQKDGVKKVLHAIYTHLGNSADENGFTEEASRAFLKAAEFK